MKKHNFFVKLFLGNLLLVGIIISVGSVVSYRYLNEEYLHHQERYQHDLLDVLTLHYTQLWPQVGPPDAAAIDEHTKAMGAQLPVHITVIAADGLVLGDSQGDPARMHPQSTQGYPVMIAALEGRTAIAVRTSETAGYSVRQMAAPIRRGEDIVGAVRVAMPVMTIVESGRYIRNALAWAALASALVAVMLALMISWLWYSPLRQITRTAREIASGNLDRRAAISGADELAQLGAALNDMRDNLTAQIRTITTQRENLAAVVGNLREGVVALDGDRKVVLINEAAIDMLAPGSADPRGQHLQSVIRVPEIVDMLNHLDDTNPITEQMVLKIGDKKRTVHLHVARVTSDPGEGIDSLVVIRDISQLVQTAAMKAEFVANASHELRTPLATIRAAMDSLQSMDPEDRDSYEKIVGIVDRHLLRLEQMTTDLLDLHLVEQAKSRLRLEQIRLGALVKWAQSYFSNKSRDKGVRLDVETNDADAEFSTDHTLVQLILQNLIDNAIKYTPTGGDIAVHLLTKGDRIVLRVADTGCGIPEEVQQRVFERFFQADPARSGDTRIRGTGLGLAIVKHASDRLGAELKLDSEPGKGTTVTVIMPERPPVGQVVEE
jgi:two-component system phosphate regulon sensor histidine kinase PhoR